MIRLFKIKEKEREFAENANSVFYNFSNMSIDENENNLLSNFSNMSIDENADTYSREPTEEQKVGGLCISKGSPPSVVGERADSIFSIFSNLNIGANADCYGRSAVKKQSAGELRLHRDITELSLPKATAIVFPNGKDLMHFNVFIWMDEGYYSGGLFQFTFEVSPFYPHEPPKLKCKTKVYHPNVDLEGTVGLNILNEDWKPVLTISTIIHHLHHLFLQPNYKDPVNYDAAAILRDNPEMFASNVRWAMTGSTVGQTKFHRCTELDIHAVLLSLLKDPAAVILL